MMHLKAIGLSAAALTAACITASPLAVAATTSARPVVDVEGIADYVYPANAAEKPGKMEFMSDGESYLALSADRRKITQYATADGKELGIVFDATHTRESHVDAIESFSISPDGSKLLVYTDSEPVYRRSFRAAYYVFEIKRNILRPLSENHKRQQAPLFSPDGRMVAFVAGNNIYIKKYDYNSEVQVTTDGVVNEVINGVPDWTYEEEFATYSSMAWAPDNSTLCYIRYDESLVPMFSFPLYGGWCDPDAEHEFYPGTFSYKYPVAGEPNSSVSVHSYDVETRKIKELQFSDSRIEYIPRIAYGDTAERLMVVTLNRAQNRMELYAANPKSTVVKSVLVEEAKAWLSGSAYENITFEPDGFVVMSERSGWNHLYRYSYTGQQLAQITSGNFDVTAYYGRDAQGFTYFQSEPVIVAAAEAPASNALNRAVYRMDRLGKKIEPLTPVEGWGAARFTQAMNYAVLSHSNASTPAVYSIVTAKGKTLRTLVDNKSYAARYASVPGKEFFTFRSGDTELNGYIIKPVGFNPSMRYPAIMWQYSGPGSQEVLNRWAMDWQQYAAKAGFVVVCVDGRGTGGRGTAFRDVVYKRLGEYETIDQLAAARYVASLPFVDAERIGMCGWSYGGYETLMAVTDHKSTFAAAVAIAPVTSWRYYDTVYTERYMLTPGENPDGYEASAPVNRAANLNCPLLIMSGTADDNVHLSNTIEFVSALQKNHRYADMFLFPNMNHSINGCNARALVYGRMIKFFADNL